jgi:hypothetical protein
MTCGVFSTPNAVPSVRVITQDTSMADEYGTIRVEEWPEGLVLWVDGQIRWRSWQDLSLRRRDTDQ